MECGDMGYTTEFKGFFELDRALTKDHLAYLEMFASVRHMKRDPIKCETLPDPYREAVGLPIGVEGEYFVGGQGYAGQDRDTSVIDYNNEPSTQPGLWCQWIPLSDGTGIEWDGNEKFYNYVEWLQYLIEHFLKPWGYTLNGNVQWQGEEMGDVGMIAVKDNVLKVLEPNWN
jgi:hypothetical protein